MPCQSQEKPRRGVGRGQARLRYSYNSYRDRPPSLFWVPSLARPTSIPLAPTSLHHPLLLRGSIMYALSFAEGVFLRSFMHSPTRRAFKG